MDMLLRFLKQVTSFLKNENEYSGAIAILLKASWMDFFHGISKL